MLLIIRKEHLHRGRTAEMVECLKSLLCKLASVNDAPEEGVEDSGSARINKFEII